ncbi:MAG: hypothetical protein ABI988_12215, partial [Nitrospirota bacterium]
LRRPGKSLRTCAIIHPLHLELETALLFFSPSSPWQPTPPKQSLQLRKLGATGYSAKENKNDKVGEPVLLK